MKKFAMIFAFFFLSSPFLVLYSNAAVTQPESMSTDISEPEVYSVNGTSQYYYTFFSNNISYLVVINVAGGSNFKIKDTWLYSDTNYYYITQQFNLNTGTLNNQTEGYAQYLESHNRYQYAFIGVNCPIFIKAPDSFVIQNDPYYVQSWVTFKASVPDQKIYNSFCTEPISDEYNRYFILAGDQKQYLYCLHYFLTDVTTIQDMASSDPGVSYDYIINNLFCPEIELSNNGLKLYINASNDILSLLNANAQSTVIYYNLQLTRYNLSDGSFIDTQLYQNINAITQRMLLNYTFDSPDDFNAVKFYGVLYNDISTQIHFNLLSCIWGVNPDFLDWQRDMLRYISLIYNSLTQNTEEVITGPTVNESNINDIITNIDNIKNVTDVSGSTINYKYQIDFAIDQGARAIDDVSGGMQTVNSLIDQLFSINPLIIVPLVVALALGLIVTILGKNKSD